MSYLLKDLSNALNRGVTKTIVSSAAIAFQGSKFIITEIGGYAVKMTNKTGAPSVKGSVVSVSPSVANSFILQANEYDSIGIVYENGIADGADCYVVTSGVAQVLWKDSTTSTIGHVALADAVDGRASDVAVPSSNPVVAEHFKEIGHVMETQGGGTNVLVKCVIHFN